MIPRQQDHVWRFHLCVTNCGRLYRMWFIKRLCHAVVSFLWKGHAILSAETADRWCHVFIRSYAYMPLIRPDYARTWMVRELFVRILNQRPPDKLCCQTIGQASISSVGCVIVQSHTGIGTSTMKIPGWQPPAKYPVGDGNRSVKAKRMYFAARYSLITFTVSTQSIKFSGVQSSIQEILTLTRIVYRRETISKWMNTIRSHSILLRNKKGKTIHERRPILSDYSCSYRQRRKREWQPAGLRDMCMLVMAAG